MINFFKSATAIVLLITLATSCNKNRVYREVDDSFTDNRWSKSDLKTFDFKIETAGNYDLSIVFSHVYETPLEHIPVNIEFNDGSEPENFNITLHLRDGAGNQISDCAGDYCDLTQEVFTNKKLAAGSYKVTIANKFDHDFLPNVLGVGIQVDKSAGN